MVAYTSRDSLGLRRGDRAVICLPMILELPISMLVAACLGVTFTVVFTGFNC
jgi:acetyl-CoA synthetase